MKRLNKNFFFLLILLSTIFLQSCGPSAKKVGPYEFHSSIKGLEQDKSHLPAIVFKRANAPGFEAYDRFIVDPILISYRDKSVEQLDAKDVQEIQKYFHDAMTKELRKAGYKVVTDGDKKTMRLSFVLSGIKAPTAIPNLLIVPFAPIAIMVGEVTVEAVFKNEAANRIDALVVSRSSGSYILNKTVWSTWADVRSSLDQWAEGVREAIDKAHAR